MVEWAKFDFDTFNSAFADELANSLVAIRTFGNIGFHDSSKQPVFH